MSGVVGMAELLSALFFMLALYMAKGAYDSKYNNIGLITETKISLSLDQKRGSFCKKLFLRHVHFLFIVREQQMLG